MFELSWKFESISLLTSFSRKPVKVNEQDKNLNMDIDENSDEGIDSETDSSVDDKTKTEKNIFDRNIANSSELPSNKSKSDVFFIDLDVEVDNIINN